MIAESFKKKFLPLKCGEIAYREMGPDGKPPLLFVHGIPTSSYLWRHVLELMHRKFHCYAPDLMGLGDTVVDPDRTEFHMASQAEMLIEFMHCLGHDAFAIVCHDQGGAAAQIIAATCPDKLTCLAITDCVCYDGWPVPAIGRLQWLAKLPVVFDWFCRSGFAEWIELSRPFSNFRRGFHDSGKMDSSAVSEYLRPLRGNRNQRRAFRLFLLAGNSSFTEKAIPGIKSFEKPTLIVWSDDDKYLPTALGQRLFDDIPGAKRFETVTGCGHFWPEECPASFSDIIGNFLEKHLAGYAEHQ